MVVPDCPRMDQTLLHQLRTTTKTSTCMTIYAEVSTAAAFIILRLPILIIVIPPSVY